MKKIVAIIITVLTMSILSSCGGSPSIIGKWEEQGGGETVEFFKDGTMIVEGISGSYSIEGNRLKVQLLWGAGAYDYRISGNTLELTEDGSSKPDVYERVND